MSGADQDLWVFGYGSLMWDPGFAFVESGVALLRGYHRRFCMCSTRYRGTPARPGLVLALDRGGACRGIAFRVAAGRVAETRTYLWEREMLDYAYRPVMVPVMVGRMRVSALTFVADRRHEQYVGRLDLEVTARVIATSTGQRGSNAAYLENTRRHLRDLGIMDHGLDAIHARVLQLVDAGEVLRPSF